MILNKNVFFIVERNHQSKVESKSKKLKSDDESSVEQSSPSTVVLSTYIENKVVEVVQNNLGELKKIMAKVYTMQKRASGGHKV